MESDGGPGAGTEDAIAGVFAGLPRDRLERIEAALAALSDEVGSAGPRLAEGETA